MALHLNYDGNQQNGIIFSEAYPNGAMYRGVEYKPDIGVVYASMQYSEVFGTLNYISVGGVKTVMLPETEAIIKDLALNWVQPLGQEGNPTEKQKQETINNKHKAYLASTDWYVIRQLETGITIPLDIQAKRLEARGAISV